MCFNSDLEESPLGESREFSLHDLFSPYEMLSWKRLCCFMGRHLTHEPRPDNILLLLCNISQEKVQVLPDADHVLPYIQLQERDSHVIT